jgi:hypothetical protein
MNEQLKQDLKREGKIMLKGSLIIMALVFLLSIVIPMTSANSIPNQGEVRQGSQATIVQSCSDATYITLATIQYPDRTVVTIDTNMTLVSPGNFQYNFTDTNQLGRYDVCVTTDGCENTGCFIFTVDNNTSNIFIILSVLAFLLCILSILGNTEFFLYSSGVIFIVTGILSMVNGIGDLSDWTTRAISLVYLGLGFIFIIGAYLDSGDFGSKEEEDF